MGKIYEPKDKFKIDEHFKQYISVAYRGMTPEQLGQVNPAQLRTAKEAFFSAWGLCLVCMRDDVGRIEEKDKAVEVMEGMLKQTTDFYIKQASRHQ